jgi:hypothetical protein
MSSNNANKRTPIQRLALSVVRAEMRLYDALSRSPRLVYERHVGRCIDELVSSQYGSRSCAHGRALHDVCAECERSEDDCKAYRVAAQMRIKELLAELGE